MDPTRFSYALPTSPQAKLLLKLVSNSTIVLVDVPAQSHSPPSAAVISSGRGPNPVRAQGRSGEQASSASGAAVGGAAGESADVPGFSSVPVKREPVELDAAARHRDQLWHEATSLIDDLLGSHHEQARAPNLHSYWSQKLLTKTLGKQKDRLSKLDKMVSYHCFREVGVSRSCKTGDRAFIPIIRTENALSTIPAYRMQSVEQDFPEVFSVEAFRRYAEDPDRKHNTLILRNGLLAELRATASRGVYRLPLRRNVLPYRGS